jgi:hypothetical protein
MALNHYFYLPIQVKTLEEIIKAHQLHFEEIIKDNFDDDEIAGFETQLDGIAAIYAQPLLSELTFEDFYSSPVEEEDQRSFFSSCVSSIAFENMPYLEANPFQVSYLKELLTRFDEVLIDQGGVTELCFKASYMKQLGKFKSIDQFLSPKFPQTQAIKSFLPVDPIDFLVLDVYQEIKRLKSQSTLPGWQDFPEEKARKLYYVMTQEHLDPASLYSKSGLSPKDFDDFLEKLKFWLKKRS